MTSRIIYIRRSYFDFPRTFCQNIFYYETQWLCEVFFFAKYLNFFPVLYCDINFTDETGLGMGISIFTVLGQNIFSASTFGHV